MTTPKPKHSNKGVPQDRETNAERAEELFAMGALRPRFVNEHTLAHYLSVEIDTLQKAIGRLPKRWTEETLKAEIAKGIFIAPPVDYLGTKLKRFSPDKADKFYAWCHKLGMPSLGQLPEEETTT